MRETLEIHSTPPPGFNAIRHGMCQIDNLEEGTFGCETNCLSAPSYVFLLYEPAAIPCRAAGVNTGAIEDSP
jgi:hypothetical protein